MLQALTNLLSSTVGVLIAVGFTIIVGTAVIITSYFLLARFRTTQQVIEKTRKKAKEVAEEISNQARQEAQHIILQANEKAAELLRSSQIFKTTAEKELDEALRKFSQGEIDRLSEIYSEITGTYHVMAEEAHRKFVKNMETASKKMIEDADKSAERLQKILEDEIDRFHSAIDQRLKGWLDSAQKEITEHKEEKIHQVDESIFRIIFLVSQQVLSKALNLEEHQMLVMRALTEAKKEGFFKV